MAKGQLEVLTNGKKVIIINSGDGFGELAILHEKAFERISDLEELHACSKWDYFDRKYL